MPEGGVTAKLRGSLESYLAKSAAELDERERLFTEKSDRVRVEQRRLVERERELAQFQSELLGPESAVGTQWVARRDRSFAEAEDVLRRRSQALDEREKELEARQLHVGTELQLRRDELERRESAVEEIAARVERREAELSAYVAQLQELQRRAGTQNPPLLAR